MPALSQNLTFTVNSTSTVVLDYPNTGTTALTYFSNRVKGDGYFGSSEGIHTFQVQTTDFIGKIEVQASLASEPTDADWFTVTLGGNNLNPVTLTANGLTVDTTGLITGISNVSELRYTTATSTVKIVNFTGNYVWVRSKVSEFTEGRIESLKINH